MKTITEEKRVFVEKCKFCDKTIKGSKESQVKFNLDLHIKQKHNGVQK